MNRTKRIITALAIILLTATTAWADTETVSYIDADGNAQTVTATVLTGNEKPSKSGSIALAAGWYVVKGNISYMNQIGFASDPSGTIHIILADGAQMAVEYNGSYAILLNNYHPLAIYGQSAGTGRLSVTSDIGAITATGGITINGGIVSATSTGNGRPAINANNGAITINGGQVTATPGDNAKGIVTEGTITLGLRSASDFITANGYKGTVNIKDGQTLYDESGNAYTGNGVSIPDNATLRSWSPDDFSVNDAGTEYTIHTATGWNVFCDLLESGESFSGKTVKLGTDIGTAENPVSRMAGSTGHEFAGTFDGQGKTLFVNITGTVQGTAPFCEIKGATIRNLVVTGSVAGKRHSAGLVGFARGDDASVENTIENCLVATDVSIMGDDNGYLGGIVGHGLKCKLTIRGCAFTGSLTSESNYTGGLQGWSDGNTLILENDIFAATSVNAANVGFHPIAFHVNNATTTATVTNVYYTVAPTCTAATRIAAAGKQARSITAGHWVTVSHAGVANTYSASGITAYKANSSDVKYTAGLAYAPDGDTPATLYAGSGDEVSLTLSNTATGDVPAGYQYGYTVSAGTLEGSTLTMPDEDVTVSLTWTGDGTEDNPYIIYNKDQLDLLAYRVNGTHGETRQKDGYKDTYFKLADDISYTHTSNWNAFTSDESNFEANGGYYNGGQRPFCGHFDGNNKTIRGIRIYKNGKADTDRYQGIFGWISSSADIHDLTLADARITGYELTGGIVGYNNGGTVSGCHVADDVAVCAVQTSANHHGGIAGYNKGTIEQCTSAATLTTADADNSMYYGGIAGYNYDTLLDNLAIGVTVPAVTMPAVSDNYYGAITGFNNSKGTLQRNYYTACTVAGTPNATDVGCENADVTANNGALPAYRLALGANITTPPGTFAGQTEWLDTPPVDARLAPENGFTLAGNHYFASGYEFTPGSTLASGAAQGYTPRATLGDVLLDLYTPTGDTDPLAGKAIARLTITADCDGKTLSAALRSDGQQHEVSYTEADGTARTAQAIALDGHEAVDGAGEVHLAAGTYYVGTDIAYANLIWPDGDITLILADGKTMTLNGNTVGIAGDYNLTIYGQSLDDAAGTLRYNGSSRGIYVNNYEQHSGNVSITTSESWVYGINANVTLRGGTLTISADGVIDYAIGGIMHSILGGQLTATATGTDAIGIIASANDGTAITLGWTNPADRITASSISTPGGGTVAVADGQALTDGSGNIYTGTLTASELSGFAAETTLQPCLALADAADNTAAITDHAGKKLAVALSGRTLYKDGSWNTLCLPFSVSTASGTLSGDNVQAMTLNTSSSNLTGSTLTLNFDAATTIDAGTPFIIKWDKPANYVAYNGHNAATCSDLVNPVFMGVTIDAEKHDATVTDVLTFTGTYAPVTIPDGGDNTKLYLGAANTLYYPNAAMTFGTHRAYFQLLGDLTAGNPASGVRAFVLNFGDDGSAGDPACIHAIDAGEGARAPHGWYTLDGRRLDGQPTAKGLYIHGGKKVVIK